MQRPPSPRARTTGRASRSITSPSDIRHQHCRGLTRWQAVDEHAQAVDGCAGAVPNVGGDQIRFRLDLVHADEHVRRSASAAAGGDATLAFNGSVHAELIFTLERQGVRDTNVVDAETRHRVAVDLPQQRLDKLVIGGERDLGPLRDCRERDAIGAVQAADEPARRFDGRLAAPRRDTGAVDHDHDQPSARSSGVRTVVGWRWDAIRSGRGRHTHELRRDDRARPAIDGEDEIVQGETGRAGIRVDRTDVDLDDFDRRCKWPGRLWRRSALQRDDQPKADGAKDDAHYRILSRVRDHSDDRALLAGSTSNEQNFDTSKYDESLLALFSLW